MKGALVWFGAAVVLAAAELLGAEFFLLMLAVGALAAAAVATVSPDPYVLPGLTFAIVSVAMIVLARPVLVRRFTVGKPANVGLERIVGATAMVLAQVDDRQGEAKVGGEIWTARVPDGAPSLPPGTEARVIEVRGATVYIERG